MTTKLEIKVASIDSRLIIVLPQVLNVCLEHVACVLFGNGQKRQPKGIHHHVLQCPELILYLIFERFRVTMLRCSTAQMHGHHLGHLQTDWSYVIPKEGSS